MAPQFVDGTLKNCLSLFNSDAMRSTKVARRGRVKLERPCLEQRALDRSGFWIPIRRLHKPEGSPSAFESPAPSERLCSNGDPQLTGVYMRRRLQPPSLGRIFFCLCFLATTVLFSNAGNATAQAPEFDIVIRHGRIVDGGGISSSAGIWGSGTSASPQSAIFPMRWLGGQSMPATRLWRLDLSRRWAGTATF